MPDTGDLSEHHERLASNHETPRIRDRIKSAGAGHLAPKSPKSIGKSLKKDGVD